eukprot:5614729-Pyramimonas_sp.AAC.1
MARRTLASDCLAWACPVFRPSKSSSNASRSTSRTGSTLEPLPCSGTSGNGFAISARPYQNENNFCPTSCWRWPGWGLGRRC